MVVSLDIGPDQASKVALFIHVKDKVYLARYLNKPKLGESKGIP
jgi:hypothetical protein